MFSDLAGFGISILSIWIGTLPSTEKYTFGYKRAEIIGALVSVLLIWGLTIALVYEAILRTMYEEDVDGEIMLITAVFGFLCNCVMAKLLHGGHDHDHHNHKKAPGTGHEIMMEEHSESDERNDE